MRSRALLRICLVIVGLAVASYSTAGSIVGCGFQGSGCGISVSIEGTQVASGTYQIDPTTGAITLADYIGGSLGSSSAWINSVGGNADPILSFGIGATTGGVGNAFSITMTLPISLTGSIVANSSISYSLTATSGAGAQLAPLFGKTLIAQEVDTTIGGLSPLNKGVDVGNTFFFVGGPATNNSPVYTASNVFVGSSQYDLMSLTIAFSLSPSTSAGLSGFVQQVPEPSGGVLLALGLGVLAWRRRSV